MPRVVIRQLVRNNPSHTYDFAKLLVGRLSGFRIPRFAPGLILAYVATESVLEDRMALQTELDPEQRRFYLDISRGRRERGHKMHDAA